MESEDKKAKADKVIEYCMAHGDSLGEAVLHADSYLRAEQLDTREKLEADVLERTDCSWVTAPLWKVSDWLNRQAAITAREYKPAIDELTAERDEWQRTAEDYQNCYDMAVKRGQNRLSKIDELTAERNYWKDQMCRCLKYVTSGYAPDIMKWPRDERKFCDPCLLVIDVADNLRDVVTQQAESFKKLEAELKAADDTANTLRASVAGLKETVEGQKVEILRLKDENAALCMKVHGAPF